MNFPDFIEVVEVKTYAGNYNSGSGVLTESTMINSSGEHPAVSIQIKNKDLVKSHDVTVYFRLKRGDVIIKAEEMYFISIPPSSVMEKQRVLNFEKDANWHIGEIAIDRIRYGSEILQEKFNINPVLKWNLLTPGCLMPLGIIGCATIALGLPILISIIWYLVKHL